MKALATSYNDWLLPCVHAADWQVIGCTKQARLVPATINLFKENKLTYPCETWKRGILIKLFSLVQATHKQHSWFYQHVTLKAGVIVWHFLNCLFSWRFFVNTTVDFLIGVQEGAWPTWAGWLNFVLTNSANEVYN